MLADPNVRARFDALDTAGLDSRKIAAELGVSLSSVYRWRAAAGRLRAAGIIPRPQADHDRAAALLEDGCSITETARTIGVSAHTITAWFPNAPRLSKRETGYMSVLARLEREVLGA